MARRGGRPRPPQRPLGCGRPEAWPWLTGLAAAPGHLPCPSLSPAAAFPLTSRTWPRPARAFSSVRTEAGAGVDRKRLPGPGLARALAPRRAAVGGPPRGSSDSLLSLCLFAGVANTAGALAGERRAGVPCRRVRVPRCWGRLPAGPPCSLSPPAAPALQRGGGALQRGPTVSDGWGGDSSDPGVGPAPWPQSGSSAPR